MKKKIRNVFKPKLCVNQFSKFYNNIQENIMLIFIEAPCRHRTSPKFCHQGAIDPLPRQTRLRVLSLYDLNKFVTMLPQTQSQKNHILFTFTNI